MTPPNEGGMLILTLVTFTLFGKISWNGTSTPFSDLTALERRRDVIITLQA